MMCLLLAGPWPGSPIAGYPWAGHIIYFLLFVCLGLTVYARAPGVSLHGP
jgi:hypothetical protein